jgi:transposase InsO family protein
MKANKGIYPVTQMARLLGVDRRRYYEWLADTKPPTRQRVRMESFTDAVLRIHAASDGTYGAPRLRAELVAEGWTVSVKTVAKAMRQAGIQGISPRSWHPITTIHGSVSVSVPDLVNRHFDQGRQDAVWLSDITYLACGNQWAYLCCVRDGATRRVLGRIVADHMRADIVEAALRQAVTLRGTLPSKVIFHADRGSQYTSQQIANLSEQLPILRSMGRTGVCWDNAQAESFWSTFKNEYHYRHVFTNLEHLKQNTYCWIDTWYNTKRRCSTIDYLSPVEYEQHLTQAGKNKLTNCPEKRVNPISTDQKAIYRWV